MKQRHEHLFHNRTKEEAINVTLSSLSMKQEDGSLRLVGVLWLIDRRPTENWPFVDTESALFVIRVRSQRDLREFSLSTNKPIN